MAALEELGDKLLAGLKVGGLKLTAAKLPSRLPHVLQLQLSVERGRGEGEPPLREAPHGQGALPSVD